MQKSHSGGMVKDDLQKRLLRAVESGLLDLMETLIEQGAHVDSINAKKQTALHVATIQGKTVFVERLLLRGASPNTTDEENCTPLHHAATNGYVGCGQALINAGANLLARDNFNQIPLHKAIQKGNAAFVDLLLKKKPLEQIGAKDEDDTSALHIAALCGFAKSFTKVLKAAAVVNPVNRKLMTPLLCAASAGHHELIPLLAERAITYAASNDGRTALHFAVSRSTEEFTKTLQALVKINVPLNAIDKTSQKETALHGAARKGSFDQVEILLAAGADASILNAEQKSAVDLLITALILSKNEQPTGNALEDLESACEQAQALQLTQTTTLLQKQITYESPDSSKKRKHLSRSSSDARKRADLKAVAPEE
jgi:ankyrin repeat protein